MTVVGEGCNVGRGSAFAVPSNVGRGSAFAVLLNVGRGSAFAVPSTGVRSRSRGWLSAVAAAAVAAGSCGGEERVEPAVHLGGPRDPHGWSQWGRDARHGGAAAVAGQSLGRVITRVNMDPFVADERAASGGGALRVHYQTPLVDGPDVFLAAKSGQYVACPEGEPSPGAPACGSAAWDRQVWHQERWSWEGGALVQKWSVESDWKPPPDGAGIGGWEPVFHAALSGGFVLVPALGGSLLVLERGSGAVVRRLRPFEPEDARTFVAGPVTVAPTGDAYYNAIALAAGPDPWGAPAAGGWLVRVRADGSVSKASFSTLVPGAPGADDACAGRFRVEDLPWPPAPDAVPEPIPCGAQRPGLNVAPAVGLDGTVYTVSRGHVSDSHGYLVAATADLRPVWAASLRGRLDDGCGTEAMPPTGEPGGCRSGAQVGVDPATNLPPAGVVADSATSSPVVAPDGSILYAVSTRYNHARGHLLHFSAGGELLGSYGAGRELTPAIVEHGGGYSIVIKEDRPGVGSYCDDAASCPPAAEGPHDITQLGSDLSPEWRFTNDNPESCLLGADGEVTCVADHPRGFAWRINAPAVDRRGVVYANGDDGVLYAIEQGGQRAEALFLGESVGAAPTPVSLDAEGRVYVQNLGRLVVVGD